MDLANARASLRAAEGELGGRDAAWAAVLRAVAVGHGLAPGAAAGVRVGLSDVVAGWAQPGAEAFLAPVHERLVADRAGSGTFYTPAWLVEWVLDRTLGAPDPDTGAPVVLDPACGCGAFLLPVVRRLVGRGLTPAEIAPRVRGVDLDPVAVAVCRLLLRLAAPGLDADVAAAMVRVGDGLETGGDHDGPAPDVVVGNPPFLGQLRRRTVRTAAGAGPAAYTDTSGLFLRRALEAVRPGGRVALVQPLSLLAARDAAPVRRAVAGSGTVTDLWASSRPVFPTAGVLTCVPVVHRDDADSTDGTDGTDDQAAVRTWRGAPDVAPGPLVTMPPDGVEWGGLAAPAYDVPALVLAVGAGVLRDLGPCTADFRDQYYGLVPHVGEAADLPADAASARLVTAGLIDPAVSRWGDVPTRFARRAWVAPVVDLEALRADTGDRPGAKLARWATARLVPKVLVATQGRVLEAVVDEHGTWLPSVPVLTLAPPVDRLWHVLAVLVAPPVVAHAVGRYLGTALGPGNLKLSAVQCGGLPLPGEVGAWDEGAALARTAQRAGEDGCEAGRVAALHACAAVMTTAYGLEGEEAAAVLAWWRTRARLDAPTLRSARYAVSAQPADRDAGELGADLLAGGEVG